MNGKFHGGRKAKVVGIPGGTPKIKQNRGFQTWISMGVNAKKRKILEGSR